MTIENIHLHGPQLDCQDIDGLEYYKQLNFSQLLLQTRKSTNKGEKKTSKLKLKLNHATSVLIFTSILHPIHLPNCVEQ